MKKLTALGISAAAYLSLASSAFAQQIGINPCPLYGNQGGLEFRFLCTLSPNGSLIGAIVALIFVIATLIAFAFLVFGGLKWVTSGGEKEKIEGSRNMIVAALVGLVIVFLAFFIINFLLSVFGLGTIQNLKIPDLTPPSP